MILSLFSVCTVTIASDIAVIPQKDHGLIVKVTDSKIDVVAKIKIPYDSSTKIIKSGKIVTLDKEKSSLIIHESNGKYIKNIALPFSSAINVKNNIVYIGGGNDSGEMCAYIDMNNNTDEIKYVDLPIKGKYGKAVDDVLIIDDRMVLVDDIVFPKYLFEYDISTATEPRLIDTTHLHGRTYEHVIKGDINKEWMIVLSQATGRWGKGVYITIYGVYPKIISYVRKFKRNSKIKESTPPTIVLDILLMNDLLYISTNVGLYYIELDKEDISIEDMTLVNTGMERIHKLIKVDDDKIFLVNKNKYELLETKKQTIDEEGFEKLDIENYKIRTKKNN